MSESTPASNPSNPPTNLPPASLLITAGPTHEPIDAVRFIGNRSSGRVGVSVADEAARRGWTVTLLLGPVAMAPSDSRVNLHRFRTAADLQSLLRTHAPKNRVLIMAAAVADYRPKIDPAFQGGKFRRTDQKLTLELEPTPDLLAEVGRSRHPAQLLVGFALEPQAELIASARAKLARKNIDLVVGNPLETMDSPTINATLIDRDHREIRTEGAIDKSRFAAWLLSHIEQRTGSPNQA